MDIRSFKKYLKTLDSYPPTFDSCPRREEAFLSIGRYLEESVRPGRTHDLVKSPNAVWAVIEHRISMALSQIEQSREDAENLRIWQWYNSGVIMKSRDVLMGLDVIPMLRTYGWHEPKRWTRRVAESLDFLLITHHHPDHYDKQLIRACLDLGKPVCMPVSLTSQWERNANLHGVTDDWSLELNDIQIRGREAFHVWRETMDAVPSVYYEVVCQAGFTFIFSGDADYTKRFEKTEGRSVDLLFLPWRNPNSLYEDGDPAQIGTTVDAVQIALDRIKPSRVLLEHYAELEHVRDGFPASYDMAVNLKRSLDVPLDWMFWGESLEI